MSLESTEIAVRIFSNPNNIDHKKAENKDSFETNIVGTGILISSSKILTCAHVIQEACKCSNNDTDKINENTDIFLDFIGNDEIYTAKVDMENWYPPKEQQQAGKLDDVALLTLEIPLKNYDTNRKCCNWQANDYLGKKFYSTGYSSDDGDWVEGQCKGINKANYIELNPNETITEGHSGGPVFDSENMDLIGMIVRSNLNKEEYKQNRAYMTPMYQLKEILPKNLFTIKKTVTLKKNKSLAPSKLAEQLAGILDRVEHIKIVEQTVKKTGNRSHCFLFEFVNDDMPNCFGQQLHIQSYLQEFRPENGGFNQRYESIRLSAACKNEIFKDQLMYKQKDFSHMLKTNLKRIVISTSVNLDANAKLYVKSILDYLKEIEDCKPSVIVLVGCVREKKGWLSGLGMNKQKKTAELIKMGAIELDPLPEISAADLVNWLSFLPAPISRLFNEDELNLNFDEMLPNDETKRYRKIYKDVQDCLEQNIK